MGKPEIAWTGKVETQVEILNRWRYAAITDGC